MQSYVGHQIGHFIPDWHCDVLLLAKRGGCDHTITGMTDHTITGMAENTINGMAENRPTLTTSPPCS